MGYHELKFYKRLVSENMKNYNDDMYYQKMNELATSIKEMYSTMSLNNVLDMLLQFETETETEQAGL